MQSASNVGFLLSDYSLKRIAADTEAVKILTYGKDQRSKALLDILLVEKLKAFLSGNGSFVQSRLVTELISGKRRYLCQVFSLDLRPKTSFKPALAVLIERNLQGEVDLVQVAKQFRLTSREREAVELLMQGLNCKEIADRMRITPQTVRVFLRTVMNKMRVSTSSGIVAKMIRTETRSIGGAF